MMKKILLFSPVFLLILALAPHVFAQGFVPLAPIPNLTTGVTANTEGLANFFNNLYRYALGLGATLAVIMITWEGLRIATNQDNVSIITDSKGKIYNAVFGLILVLSPYLVFSIINPSILNLSLNLPPLNTAPSTPIGAGGAAGTQPSTVDTATGCTITGNVLQKASCPSVDAAQTFVSKCSGYGVLLPITTGPTETCAIVNGQQVCTQKQVVPAACERSLSGSFIVINLGQTLSLTTVLRPVGSNSTEYANFAVSCKQDQGTFCGSRPLSAISCPSTINVTLQSGQSGKCYDVTSIYCGSSFCGTQGGSILPTQ